MVRRIVRPVLAAFAAALLVAPSVSAQTPDAILERYNKAVDPNGVLASIQGMKSSVTMEAPSMGMSMTINSVAARPNLVVVVTDVPGLGVIRQGFDGTTAWSSDPMQGPRILNGMEAAALVEGSSFNNIVRSKDLFSAMELAGTYDAGGDMTSCVKFTWKSGRETTDCFSNATGLIARTLTKQVTQMGEVEVEMFIKDYRPVNGLVVPFRVESNMMGMAMTITTTSMEFTAQPASMFELPAEIKRSSPEVPARSVTRWLHRGGADWRHRDACLLAPRSRPVLRGASRNAGLGGGRILHRLRRHA